MKTIVNDFHQLTIILGPASLRRPDEHSLCSKKIHKNN